MTIRSTTWARRAAACAAAVLALLATAGTGAAGTAECRRLEAQLAAAASPAALRKYEDAVDRQREHLQIARRQARNAGCGFALFRSGQACDAVAARIDKMERNLARLEARRAELARRGQPQRERARLLAAIEARGCREARAALPEPLDVSTERGTRSLFDQLFGRPVPRGLPEERQLPPLREDDSQVRRILRPDGRATVRNLPGEFATLCVRTCDGYVFPMSTAASAIDLDRDQQRCASACPGADVRLYYRRLQDGDDSMPVSWPGGEPYAALATAYRYRAPGQRADPACGCRAAPGYSVVAGVPQPPEEVGEDTAPAPAAAVAAPSGSVVTIAPPATAPAAEPPRPEARTAAAAPAPEAGERRVRVVGPTFLPDPEAAIDLRAPGRTEAR